MTHEWQPTPAQQEVIDFLNARNLTGKVFDDKVLVWTKPQYSPEEMQPKFPDKKPPPQ